MSCSEVLKLQKTIPSKTRRAEGRMEKNNVYRLIIFKRSCSVLKVNLSGKTAYVWQHVVPNVCQNRRPY